VENEKGLLVSFQIVAARVLGAGAAQSLNLAVGTVGALSAVDVVWDLVCDLNGTFSNYVRARRRHFANLALTAPGSRRRSSTSQTSDRTQSASRLSRMLR
jgi:hypothetical protein